MVGAEKLFACRVQRRVDFFLGGEREAVKQLAPKGAARRRRPRLRPKDAGYTAFIVTSICVLAAVDDDARVQKRRAKRPQYRRDSTGLCC